MSAIFEQIERGIRQITFLGRSCIVGINEREPRILKGFTQKIILSTDDWRIFLINTDTKGMTYIFDINLNRFLYSTLKLLAEKNSILVYDGTKSNCKESTMQFLN